MKRGLHSLWQLEFEQALDDLDAAIEGGIKEPRAFAGRSRAKMFQGKLDDAIVDMKKAVELDPLDASYHHDLSQMMMGRASIGGSRGGVRIKDEGGAKLQNPDAKKEAGLAAELDPENDAFREWFERFE